MYVSNRKHSYKVIRKYRRTPRVKLETPYGAIMVVALEKLEQYGYKFVNRKPSTFRK